jgi:hypothetical protein
MRSLAAIASFAVAGCCFTPPTAPTAPPPSAVAPVVAPSPPEASPAPIAAAPAPPAAPPSGPLRSGTLTVDSATGGIVDIGDVCTYSQVGVPPDPAGLDVRWTVRCGEDLIYGGGTAGWGRSSDPSWPAGTVMLDSATSSADGDPSFEWSEQRIVVRDDDSGALGEFLVEFQRPATP